MTLVDQVLTSDSKQQVITDVLGRLTLRETLGLVKHLESEWGVSAKPQAQEVPPREVEVEEVEQTEFDVIVTEVGQTKINVIKAVRALTGDTLKASKDRLNALPVMILSEVGQEAADRAKADLEAAGATVEVK